MSEQSPELLPQHVKLLDTAGISAEVAAARGYQSLTTRTEVRDLGFPDRQTIVPSLLIPLYGLDGSLVAHQIQPDRPRSRHGVLQPVEMPDSKVIHLDVPPTVADLVQEDTPVIVAASVLVADAAASRDLPVISFHGSLLLPGHPRREAIPWPTPPLTFEHRTILLDADLPDDIRDDLAAHLAAAGAEVRVLATGLRDCLTAGDDLSNLTALAERWEPPAMSAAAPVPYGSDYEVRDGSIVWCRSRESGQRDLPLGNFTAVITEEVIADDGQDDHGELVITGRLATGRPLPVARVAIERYDAMHWISLAWGAGAIVTAGYGARDHLRAAIQWLSPEWPTRRIYTHPGWLDKDGTWFYLTQEMVIGPDGPADGFEVRLEGAANRIRLGAPPAGEALRTAVTEALRLLDLAPDRITVPLFGGVIRAVLTPAAHPDVVLFLIGPSGVLKSELASAFQRAFGSGFDRLHLPASWAATPNALERVAFTFKDCLVVIDDFAPAGSVQDVRRYHQTADRMIRGAGNASGRDRMQSDGTLRRALPPRGLILGTGEDVPRGHSIRARMLVLEVDRTSVNRVLLGRFQTDGRSVASAMMAAFVQWLAARMDRVRTEFPQAITGLRSELSASGTHARTPDALAGLGAAWRLWLRFAVESGALTGPDRDVLWERVQTALRLVAASQAAHLQDEDPVRAFLDLLRGTLTAGAAHVVTPEDRVPESRPSAWGWFRQASGGLVQGAAWVSRGDRIGWIDGGDLYLDPTAAYRTVQHYAASSGTSLAITAPTLWKRLREGGYLQSVETGQQSNMVRKTIGDNRRRVIHLAASTLVAGVEEDDSTDGGQVGRVGRVFDTGGGDSADARTRGPDGTALLRDEDGDGKVAHDA